MSKARRCPRCPGSTAPYRNERGAHQHLMTHHYPKDQRGAQVICTNGEGSHDVQQCPFSTCVLREARGMMRDPTATEPTLPTTGQTPPGGPPQASTHAGPSLNCTSRPPASPCNWRPHFAGKQSRPCSQRGAASPCNWRPCSHDGSQRPTASFCSHIQHSSHANAGRTASSRGLEVQSGVDYPTASPCTRRPHSDGKQPRNWRVRSHHDGSQRPTASFCSHNQDSSRANIYVTCSTASTYNWRPYVNWPTA